jgi:hypothetical protein
MRTGGWSGELNPAASRVSNRLMMRESLDGSFSLRLVMKGTVTGDATKKAVLCLLLKIDFVVVVVVVVEKAWLPLTINSKIDGKDRIVIEQNRIDLTNNHKETNGALNSSSKHCCQTMTSLYNNIM